MQGCLGPLRCGLGFEQKGVSELLGCWDRVDIFDALVYRGQLMIVVRCGRFVRSCWVFATPEP